MIDNSELARDAATAPATTAAAVRPSRRRGLTVLAVALGIAAAPLVGGVAAADARPPAPDAVVSSVHTPAVKHAVPVRRDLAPAEQRLLNRYGRRMDNLPLD